MSRLRINPPGQPIRHVDLGPALARLTDWDVLRQRLDIALSHPKRVPAPVYLEQPKR